MKIQFNEFITCYPFNKIRVGAVFYDINSDDFYMKTEELQSITGEIFNAVNISNGIIESFSDNMEFEIVESKVVIGKGVNSDDTNN